MKIVLTRIKVANLSLVQGVRLAILAAIASVVNHLGGTTENTPQRGVLWTGLAQSTQRIFIFNLV